MTSIDLNNLLVFKSVGADGCLVSCPVKDRWV